ncbi:hypothetical protein V8B97DRAFT_1973637 [Scleroderma yunnanense]
MQDLTSHISREHAVSPAIQTPARPPASRSHQCQTCQKSFSSPGALAAHQQAKKHLVCSACNQTFSTLEQLEKHTSDIHPPPVPPPPTAVKASPSPKGSSSDRKSVGPRCTECERTFNCYADLENHVGASHKFPCSKCHQRFPSLVEWNSHFIVQHKFQCGACKTSFSTDVALASHGSYCPAATPVRPQSSQSVHVEASSSAQQSKFTCDNCKKTFKSSDGLRAHVASKHPSVPSCGICQFKGTSAAALEEHVNKIHCCTICQDSILRDTKTLEDHMYEHTHPYRCKKCGTKYQSEAELSTHFASPNNYHPVCLTCQIGFEDETGLRSHVCSVHPSSRKPTPQKLFVCPNCPEPFVSQIALEAHVVEVHSPIFKCHICGVAYSAQSALSDHIVIDHSCPICHDGVYVNAKCLEEHLEDHRAPYRCVSCDTRYSEEGLLLQHYKDASNDIHPACMRCNLGFENNDAYNLHVSDVHRPTPCEPCGGLVFDERDIPTHYLSSKNHPMCTICHVGFKDGSDFADHGALEHPESHCKLCRWQFDSPETLNNHIRHFVNHPKCADCDLRFPDADTYQHHLFVVHCSNANKKTAVSPVTTTARVGQTEETRVSPFLSPTQRIQTFDGQFALESNIICPLLPSSIPLPPSISGYSSPTSQRVVSDTSFQQESRARSCSPALSLDHPSRESNLREFVHPSLTVDTASHVNGYPDFDHSPLSTIPAVGTPPMTCPQSGKSFYFQGPFLPRAEGAHVSTDRGVNGGIDRTVHFIGEEESGSSSFTRSPQLISPAVKLPSPVTGSQTSSGWTSDGGSVTKLSLNSCVSSPPVVKVVFDSEESRSLDPCTPDSLTSRVPGAGNLVGGMTVSASPVSPESAGLSVSAVTQTPEYLREARAYLSLTHQTPRSSTPPVPHSPTNSSPILSSTGLALGERGRRREVRFEENIMSEPVWDRESTSSDASLDDPHPYRRSNGIHTKKYGVSRLPRFAPLKRRRFVNARPNHLSHLSYGRTFDRPSTLLYHCRICLKDQCEELTTTTCGHLFCYE